MDILSILADQKKELESIDFNALIHRSEEAEINLDSPLAQVVTGVRRCGKSTLCAQALQRSGIAFGYINFDDERLINVKIDDLDQLLQGLYRLNGAVNHIFLDEVQNVRGWELFVNRLLRQKIHLLITGSNANLLSSELTTHLTGRHHEIKLFPFSFREYCEINNVAVGGYTTLEKSLRRRLLDRYLFEGGFPEIDKGVTPRDYAQTLLQTIIYKDICQRNKIRYKETVWRLANIVLDHTGQEQKSTLLARELGIGSAHTVDNYLRYFTDAYLMLMPNKFSWKSVDRRRSPKAYAIDPAFLTHHESALQTASLGWRLENIVAIELIRRNDKKSDGLYYLRDGRDYEVDFVVVEGSRIKELIQVTYDFTNPTTKAYNREIGGLIKGSVRSQCDNLTLIVMEGEAQRLERDGKQINVLPASEWLTGNY